MNEIPLNVPPFASSLISMTTAVGRRFGLGQSDAYFFGATGHAFLMHVHRELCPSGPYTFDRGPFYRLAEGAGVKFEDLGFFGLDSGSGERAEVERRLKEAVEAGLPAGLVNMEYQAITGFDAEGFTVLPPWPSDCGPWVERLTFGSWQEFGESVHANFFVFQPVPPQPLAVACEGAFRWALELWDAPASTAYATGKEGYRHWVEALEEHGQGHGCWWNGAVWTEGKQRAADFLEEAAGGLGIPKLASASHEFRAAAQAMTPLLHREAEAAAKREGLLLAQVHEEAALSLMRECLEEGLLRKA